MTLEDVKTQITRMPTIMSAEQEIQVFRSLMQVPVEALTNKWKDLDFVMSRLCESHSDTFYEVSDKNRSSFLEFSDWLDRVAPGFDERRRASLMQAAEHFRIDPSSVEGSR